MRYVVYPMKDSHLSSHHNGNFFYFTTPTNKAKFDDRINDFVEDETVKFTYKRGIPINLDLYCSLILYRMIEKRGFRIVVEGKEISSWQQVKFVSSLRMSDNLKDQ